MIKSTKGLTLISLIITVIILLILAGTAISISLNGGDIFGKTSDAREITEISHDKQSIQLALVMAQGIAESENITKENFMQQINNEAEVFIDGENYAVHFFGSDRYYSVTNSGDITEIDVVIDKSPGNIKEGMSGEILTGISKETAFEIWSIEDLIEWSTNYNTYKTSYIKLCRTLDFKSELSYVNPQSKEYGDINQDGEEDSLIDEMQKGKGFKPIVVFNGTFDGQNNILKNIYIVSDNSSVAFIKTLSATGTIKNFIISGYLEQTNNIETNNNFVGGIVADTSGIVVNCGNMANIISKKPHVRCGGIAGMKRAGSVECCFNNGEIVAASVAGIVNTSWGGESIKNCYNIGKITSDKADSAGGIESLDSSGIFNSYNRGDLISVGADKSVYSAAGGIYGYISNGMTKLTIGNCYSTGELSNVPWGGKGPIIGQVRVVTPNILNCFFLDTTATSTQATSCTEAYLKSSELLNQLNCYIEGNEDDIDTIGWAKWIKGADGYPALDFYTQWNGEEWVDVEF